MLVAWILVFTAYREQKKVPPPRQDHRSTEHGGEDVHLADLSSANEQSGDIPQRTSTRISSRRSSRRGSATVDPNEDAEAIPSSSEPESSDARRSLRGRLPRLGRAVRRSSFLSCQMKTDLRTETSRIRELVTQLPRLGTPLQTLVDLNRLRGQSRPIKTPFTVLENPTML